MKFSIDLWKRNNKLENLITHYVYCSMYSGSLYHGYQEVDPDRAIRDKRDPCTPGWWWR